MLEHLLFDAGFLVGSSIADSLSTHAFVNKFGIDKETCLENREGMHSEGSGKYLFKQTVKESALLLGVSAALYGIDYALGIQENAASLHHAYLYTLAGMKYLAAASNTFKVVGMKRADKAAHFPVRLFIKKVVPLVNRTIGKPIKVGNYSISLGLGAYDQ